MFKKEKFQSQVKKEKKIKEAYMKSMVNVNINNNKEVWNMQQKKKIKTSICYYIKWGVVPPFSYAIRKDKYFDKEGEKRFMIKLFICNPSKEEPFKEVDSVTVKKGAYCDPWLERATGKIMLDTFLSKIEKEVKNEK